jgi:hypothetical protein
MCIDMNALILLTKNLSLILGTITVLRHTHFRMYIYAYTYMHNF